jgi:ABC-2 type transport system permease protein
VNQLAPAFRQISHANPFFYDISGFRAGFLGISDSPLWIGGVGLLVLNVVLWAICYRLLKTGWKIKN